MPTPPDEAVRQVLQAVAAVYGSGPQTFVERAASLLAQAAAPAVPLTAGWCDGGGHWRPLIGRPPARPRPRQHWTPVTAEDPWAGPRRAAGGVWRVDHGAHGWSAWRLAGPPTPPPLLTPVGQAVGRAGELWLPQAALPGLDLTPAPVGVDVEAGARLYGQLEPLTADCLRLAAQGWTNAQVADWLGVSRSTVTRRLTRAYTALGVAGRRELPLPALLSRPKPPREPRPEAM